MVDGTLVLLYSHPSFYGNSWYDHKSNYSMNVQIVSTPDLCIIDYSVGLPSSQHDSPAFVENHISKEHLVPLGGDDMTHDTSSKAEKDTEEKTTYNYYVSKVCI
ncbi:hypothetical protein PAXRUDRAFT_769110 [Paxillus rubicundulus Ve08.2h10]|uniref:DDE Tnp4 domain-containing protein n=1 Tax=Paxillus rubicundulus Ve08.2h10 TaxID=930991 RepID=A0A0D0DMB6_9AGAM|nr:hypothetical protein PAXRUDRAFT_769110 [Paxillus rubicundulus Ve08.2h10]